MLNSLLKHVAVSAFGKVNDAIEKHDVTVKERQNEDFKNLLEFYKNNNYAGLVWVEEKTEENNTKNICVFDREDRIIFRAKSRFNGNDLVIDIWDQNNNCIAYLTTISSILDKQGDKLKFSISIYGRYAHGVIINRGAFNSSAIVLGKGWRIYTQNKELVIVDNNRRILAEVKKRIGNKCIAGIHCNESFLCFILLIMSLMVSMY